MYPRLEYYNFDWSHISDGSTQYDIDWKAVFLRDLQEIVLRIQGLSSHSPIFISLIPNDGYWCTIDEYSRHVSPE